MACCAALAIVLAAVRAAWSRLSGRELVDGAFPPAATWAANRGTAASAREQLDPPPGTLLGLALGATVLAYGALIHLLAATDFAHVQTSGTAGWFVRDAVLGVAIVGLLTVRRRIATPSALVGVGALWFALGVVDMHLLGAFEFRAVPLVLDTAFHLSGWWLMVAAAGVAIVQRRQVMLPVGSVA
jgi:hypothetical protein